MRRLITTFSLIILLSSPFLCVSAVHTPSCTNTGGCGYETSARATCISASVALATVLIGSIVAIAFHNNKSSNGHAHE